MEGSQLISAVAKVVREKFETDTSGHDWYHMQRVWHMARHIGTAEGANMLEVELGALLHDIADHKFHDHDLSVGPIAAARVVRDCGGSDDLAERIGFIVGQISYKGAGVATPTRSLEAAVVQDADRLDAIGAIGIARAFSYGGHNNRSIYDPNVGPEMHGSFEAYAHDKGHTINHFYEKLLLLKDRMQTETGKRLALKRHNVMEAFLEEFFEEWNARR